MYRLLSYITSDCLNSAIKHYKVLKSITKYYKVLQSITKYYKELQSITKINLAHILGPIFGLVFNTSLVPCSLLNNSFMLREDSLLRRGCKVRQIQNRSHTLSCLIYDCLVHFVSACLKLGPQLERKLESTWLRWPNIRKVSPDPFTVFPLIHHGSPGELS